MPYEKITTSEVWTAIGSFGHTVLMSRDNMPFKPAYPLWSPDKNNLCYSQCSKFPGQEDAQGVGKCGCVCIYIHYVALVFGTGERWGLGDGNYIYIKNIKNSELAPICLATMEFEGVMKTLHCLKVTSYPLSANADTETRFFLSPGT